MDKIEPEVEKLILDLMKEYKITYSEAVRKGVVSYKYLRKNVIDKDRELYVLKEDGILHKVQLRGN